MRILISGTCAPALNSNYGLIEAIAVGFQQLNDPEIQLVPITQLLEAISEWKPHLTLLVGGLALETIPLALVHHLCRQANSKLTFWSLEDPYELDWMLQQGAWFDLICTTDFSSRCFYPGEWRVEHLPLAAPEKPAPQSGQRLQPPGRWLFCGVPFPNRINCIEEIRRIHPDGLLIGPEWPSYNPPTTVSHRRISSEMLHTLYQTMPITLSIGRRHDLANSARVAPSTPGPRLFEAAGCGAAQLVCDSGLEISCYYEPEQEFLWARSAEEASDWLERASMDPIMVDLIGQRAWKRTQAEHLYSHRARQLLSWIREL
jgi:spore maturation protein CgeB